MTTEAAPTTATATDPPPASVTTWTRLEPQLAAPDLRESAAARVEDPAWLLARQWQLGEFHGDDGGSPVGARLRTHTGAFVGYRNLGTWTPEEPGSPSDNIEPYDPATLPLETMVEREPDGDTDLSIRADGGRQFLRLLAAAGLQGHRQAFVTACPLPTPAPGPTVDPATADRLAVLGTRVPDGRALATLFGAASPALPPSVPAVDRAAVLAVGADFLARWGKLVSRPDGSGSAWAPDRAEHRFALGTYLDYPVVLEAAEYPGGSLDWADLSFTGDQYSVPCGDQPDLATRTVLPTPLRYPGMPADRWWEFEDAKVSYVGTEAGAPDLGRLLMLEFATLYSNDWFVVPVELPVGTITRVSSLVVTDTFGVSTVVTAADGPDWRMFGGRYLVLPPALPDAQDGKPIEDVLLLRDEGANVCWAVEQVVESVLGTPVNRQEQHLAALREEPPAAEAGADLVYRLRAGVPPAHWIPLIPRTRADGLVLTRSALRPPGGEPIPPAGSLLAHTEHLAAEEIPRDGARLTRAWQRARWTDGSTHLWLSRRKQTGPGEASSGLRHDLLDRREG